jgi:hypothetical protein
MCALFQMKTLMTNLVDLTLEVEMTGLKNQAGSNLPTNARLYYLDLLYQEYLLVRQFLL